ncbi:MAG: histidine phosphatase family protein [Pseudomonadota bacterium]
MPRADVEIVYVRHGETLWNRQRRMQGHKDSPLTVTGLRQAAFVGRLVKTRFGAELGDYGWRASPLGRAWQTAVIAAETAGIDPTLIERDDQLKEMTWGDWDGLTAAEIEARDPQLWAARIADRWTVSPPGGGETQAAILARAAGWLAGLPQATRLVTVAHGALGRALRCAYLGLPPADMLTMEEPHDAIFWLKDGNVSKLEA